MRPIKRFFAASITMGVAASALAGMNYTTATVSLALSKAQIESVSGTPSAVTFYSSSFIKSPTANNLLVIQDPSGATGTGLITINLSTFAGSVIATDAALNVGADETIPSADQDSNGFAIDPATSITYLVDREDTDEILAITSGGSVTTLSAVTAATLSDSGCVFDTGSLYYANDGDDTIKKYNIGGNSESIFVSTANWTAVTGGTALGNSAGPVRFGNKLLFFDETAFLGSDQIVAVDINTAAVSIYVPKALFGVGTEPGFSTMVVTQDGTIIGWDENGAGAANKTFVVIPQGTGSPIRFTQAAIAAALGVAATAVDPSDENAMCVIADDNSSVQVLFGISGTGDIGKLTFTPNASVDIWNLY